MTLGWEVEFPAILSKRLLHLHVSAVSCAQVHRVTPNVDVVATDVGTGVRAATETNDPGFYSVHNLPLLRFPASHEEIPERALRNASVK